MCEICIWRSAFTLILGTAQLIKYSTRHNYLHVMFLNCLGTSLFFALFSVLVPQNLADQLDIDRIHTSEKYSYDFLKSQFLKYLNNYFSHAFLFLLLKKENFDRLNSIEIALVSWKLNSCIKIWRRGISKRERIKEW